MAIPTSLISAKTVLYLGAALALSLAGNAVLFWQLAQAKPECAAKRAGDAYSGAVTLIRGKDARDAEASAVARQSAERANAAQAAIQRDLNSDKKAVNDAYREEAKQPAPVAGNCVVLRPVPAGVQDRIDAAVQRANE